MPSPDWSSLAPPLVAIVLALAIRQVVVALAAGVWLGAFLIHDGVGVSFARFLDTYVAGALADESHAKIIVFSLLLGGMLGLITQSGGGRGLAVWATKMARTPRSGQLTTWFLGLLVFFDDYANSLLVGASMRPVSDKLRISREKLAFVVDATAAPVSSIALISSWIGVEIGYIHDQFQALGIADDAYLTFIRTIPYRFYPLLMLGFVFWSSFRGRDFGPMLRAETRARLRGELVAPGSKPASDFMDEGAGARPGAGSSAGLATDAAWQNALFPIGAVVLVAIVGMYVDGLHNVVAEGGKETLGAIFSAASSTSALLWAAAAGCLVAVVASLATRALSFAEAMEAWLSGLRSILLACVILVLAWALGDICRELHTAQYLVDSIRDWTTPGFVPAVVFVLAALVSFATGTSWGTMAILFPLVVPLAHHLAPGNERILLGTISSVLAGSVWGDHCSPISDTTILSSMATSCDHMDHVRTQLPYALLVGGVSLLVGEIGVGFGWYGPWVGLLLAATVLGVSFELLSRPVPAHRAKDV